MKQRAKKLSDHLQKYSKHDFIPEDGAGHDPDESGSGIPENARLLGEVYS